MADICGEVNTCSRICGNDSSCGYGVSCEETSSSCWHGTDKVRDPGRYAYFQGGVYVLGAGVEIASVRFVAPETSCAEAVCRVEVCC